MDWWRLDNTFFNILWSLFYALESTEIASIVLKSCVKQCVATMTHETSLFWQATPPVPLPRKHLTSKATSLDEEQLRSNRSPEAPAEVRARVQQ